MPETDAGTAGARGSRGGMMGSMRGMGGRGMMGGMIGRGGMGSMMGRRADEPAYDTMTINGKAYPATEPLLLERDERVRLRLINASAEHTHAIRLAGHPLRVTHADGNALRDPVVHQHGQSFRVLAVNGARLAAPLVKDTADVEAHSGSAEIEFTAHNPGDWVFHCHKPMHMEGGRIAPVTIAG